MSRLPMFRQFLRSRSLRRGGMGAKTYAQILQEDYGADEVWPLVDIASGTTINAHVNSNRNGSLTGWDLQNAAGPVAGTLAPYSDGSSDKGDIYSSNGSDGLDDIFDGGVGSIVFWTKLGSSVWTDSTTRFLMQLRVDSNNRIILLRTTTNNQLQYFYSAGGTSETVNHTTSGPTSWIMLGLSWDVNAGASGEVKAFLNDGQVGSTQTGLGTWSGALNSDRATIGCSTASSGGAVWDGHMAYAAVRFGTAWTPTEFQNIYNEASP